ncbi:MAG: oxidoreductase [Thiotrichales bacterium]
MSEFQPEPDLSHTNTAIVEGTRRITPDSTDEVRQIFLRVDDTAFQPREGEIVGVLTPGPHPFGNKSHHRYYTVASVGLPASSRAVELELLVRRCFYIDEVSGERYPGIASNYLCEVRTGDRVTLTGPFRNPFKIPDDPESNLLMLGTGTGVAPFRALVRRIYDQHGNWKGKVRLFYGARSGTEMLYMNDANNDLVNYYDRETFRAFQAIAPRPLADESDALSHGIDTHAQEIWALLQDPKTHVYLAGMKKIAAGLEQTMSRVAGSATEWQRLRQQLVTEKRWNELTYQ